MQVVTTASCTPYLIGNTPHFGEHIAWAESSAVCYANSVLGARTNREGGPSALAASLTGRTPEYGYHLDDFRKPTVTIGIDAKMDENAEFGALGKVLGEKVQQLKGAGGGSVPYIQGINNASVENLKSFCASVATYGGVALFHMEGITPESAQMHPPETQIRICEAEIEQARADVLPTIEAGDLAAYQTLRRRKGGLAVVQVRNGACGGCGIVVSPALEWQLRHDGLSTCGNCGRIIVRT